MNVVNTIIFWISFIVIVGSIILVFATNINRRRNLVTRKQAIHIYLAALTAIVFSYGVLQIMNYIATHH